MKKIIALSLVAGGLAFAQSGLQGGTSGIHQHNAYTLGQWGIEVGTGGDISTDSWSQSRGGVIKQGNQERSFHSNAGSLSGNIHAAIGLKDFIDLGVALPLYYDHANLKGDGEGDLWQASRGDLNVWLKAGLIGDSKSFFGLAIQGDVYFPTGDENVGVRPRHAWYLNDNGGNTNPYTSGGFNYAGTVVLSLNFGALGVPVLWNTHASFVYADKGTNTLVYGTGLNVMPTDWMDIFVEYSGEMRIEDGAYRRDPMDDPMLLTPGFRFHLPWHIDFALGADIAFRTLANLAAMSRMCRPTAMAMAYLMPRTSATRLRQALWLIPSVARRIPTRMAFLMALTSARTLAVAQASILSVANRTSTRTASRMLSTSARTPPKA